MAANKILFIDPLRGSLSLKLSLPDRQKPCWFSQLDVIWFPFWFWCCRLGNPAWVRLHSSQGQPPQPLKYPSRTSAAALGRSSRDSSILPTSLVVVKWFLLSVLGYKASLQLVFSWLFWTISLQFCCNSRLALRGGQCSFHLLLCHLGSSFFSISSQLKRA